jgi:hypothetical protein
LPKQKAKQQEAAAAAEVREGQAQSTPAAEAEQAVQEGA